MKNLIRIALLLFTFSCYAQSPNLSSEEVWAVRTANGHYELHSNINKALKVYQGSSPEIISWNKALTLKKGQPLKVENKASKRLYFATIINRDTLVFSERRLAMAGTPNFRDLGGLKTKDGKQVQWGKVFRCGDMGSLDHNDLELIRNLNIATVVDLRGEQEITRSPDRYPSGSEIKRINTVIGASNPNRSNGLLEALNDPGMTGEKMDSLFNLYYKYAVGSIRDYKPLFDELLSAGNDESVLFHCSAGKDRTGVGSALILSALGVPEETIVEEFYLSNLYTKDLLKNFDRYEGANPEALAVLSGVQPYYIKTTLDEIKKQYGSIENMLKQELGIDENKRRELIARYTF